MRKLFKQVIGEVTTYPETFIGAPGLWGMTAGANYLLTGAFTLAGLPVLPLVAATLCFVGGLYALTACVEVGV